MTMTEPINGHRHSDELAPGTPVGTRATAVTSNGRAGELAELQAEQSVLTEIRDVE